MPIESAVPSARQTWPPRAQDDGWRITAEETPVAMVHDAATTAVMMATPADLEDFAIGFGVTEGVIEDLAEVASLDIVELDQGIEARMWLTGDAGARAVQRRRRMTGPVGCGLCGVDSLAEALREPPRVRRDLRISAEGLLRGMDSLGRAQDLGRATRAVHAAGFWRDDALVMIREDVGRHNALDKLVGGLVRGAVAPDGVVLLTSRVSVDMVQKTAQLGAPILCAVSAPTALAIRLADRIGLTLVAVCRADGFEVFTHPHRIET